MSNATFQHDAPPLHLSAVIFKKNQWRLTGGQRRRRNGRHRRGDAGGGAAQRRRRRRGRRRHGQQQAADAVPAAAAAAADAAAAARRRRPARRPVVALLLRKEKHTNIVKLLSLSLSFIRKFHHQLRPGTLGSRPPTGWGSRPTRPELLVRVREPSAWGRDPQALGS